MQEGRILHEAPVVTFTASEIRDILPVDLEAKLADAIDEAQAPVFTGEQPFNYVVIKIVKG